ncbi:MAG TPA: hydroxymethylbilane synthase [Candidatus Saccharimonadales bacterium]|nr:hydroxymethylbilane synthase [Candidatus Saccharimonadales bacterium]
MDKLVIGTRGSKLSLTQTEIVQKKLQIIFPKKKIEIKIIKTTGDVNMNPIPLDTIGKGWFTKELDKALLDEKIDMAVHSLKDIPEVLQDGLSIAAIPEREDAREALVSKNNVPFEKLKKNAVVGTDSARRKSQILHKRPDLIVKSIRGNIHTRLKKLDSGEYDGILVAVAGLKRLGLQSRISQYFSETDIVPSPGQGALAITVKKNNTRLIKELEKLNNSEIVTSVYAERAFSKALGGGCKMPVGSFATVKQNKIVLHGFVGSLDGSEIYKDTLHGSITLPEIVGTKMANKFLKKRYAWFVMPQVVVITRSQKASVQMQKDIEALGLQSHVYSSISITKNTLSPKSKKIFTDIATFDWLLFTSQNGIQFFVQTLKELAIPLTMVKNCKIATVGTKTAEAVKKFGLQVDFVPSNYSTDNLADELEDIKNKKILMARANIATPGLVKKLRDKGAQVIDIPIYKTTLNKNHNPEFENLLTNQQIYCITFTSPSTVKGFMRNVKNAKLHNAVLSIPALSIGPVTTKELQRSGFENIITAEEYTISGMIAKLKESIL